MHTPQQTGLTTAQAAQLLAQYGPNALAEKPKTPFLARVWGQVRDPMVLVLLGAALISGLLGEWIDSLIILAVVLLNTAIGLIQEQKAEAAIEALKKMSAQTARVVRDGAPAILPAEQLVPGDLVLLEAGDLVPADLRLLESASLKVEEASLTGESVPAEKNASADVAEDAPLGDRLNRAFNGTSVTYGRGRGIVEATGMRTQMGRIAHIINAEPDEETPLQKKLGEIGRTLTVVVIGICVLVFAAGVLRGGLTLQNALHAFLMSVSLAVAAIPEGLPAVVTIVMAMGVTRMAQRKAIIKRLPAVETLGCAQIICSDKTGTLTQNRMNVRQVYARGSLCPAEGYEAPAGARDMLIASLCVCNDAVLRQEGDLGDPTETALKRFALSCGLEAHLTAYPRVDERPFDSERKMMSTVNDTPDGRIVFTKGAPDELLRCCTHIVTADGVAPLSEELRAAVLAANREMALQALRVLGGAYKPFREGEDMEVGLILAGLAGMIDPPRPEVYEAVARCRSAGITPIMITGDHKDTAMAIAREIGLLEDGCLALFGRELDAMSEEELDEKLPFIRVYARVSPENKVRIVRAWKKRGMVVAMTGDGVNDAPALKAADIGVGMGITGTDVSKGVADMLLSDDNFATIVSAVEEGRKIYTNIRKAVQFLLSSNISEVLALFVATLALPQGVEFLSPVHILFINLVTDSLPAIGLGLNKAEPGVMQEPPRNASESFFAHGLSFALIYQGAFMAALVLGAYAVGRNASPVAGTSMAFVTLSVIQLFHSFNIKAGKRSIFHLETLNNPTLLLSALLPLAMLVIILNVPAVAAVFSVTALTLVQWLQAVGMAALIIPLVEIVKLIMRLSRRAAR